MGYQGRTMLRDIVLDESRKSSGHIVACGKDEALGYVDVYSNPQWIHMNHDEFCENNGLIETRYAMHRNSFKDASLDANDSGVPLEELLDCTSMEHNDGENPLINFDWPDIGDFGDIDEMFRNCDFTFGRGSTSTADGLSWFSSSSNKPADAFESGLPSSCSKLSVLNSTYGHHRTSSIFFDEKDQIRNDFHKSPNSKSYCSMSHYDAGYTEKYTANEQAYAVNQTAAAIHQRSVNNRNGTETSAMNNLCMKPSESELSPSLKRKNHPSDHTSSSSKLPSHVSTPQSTQVFTEQNLLWQQPSSNLSAALSHPIELENDISMGHLSFTNASFVTNVESEVNSCGSNGLNYDPKCMEHLHQFSGSSTVGAKGRRNEPNLMPQTGTATESLSQRDFSTCTASAGKRHYKLQHGINGSTREVSRNTKQSATDFDYLGMQEGSCISSGCNGRMSLEAASLEQLQDAIHKLDDSMKVQIRDSLYRLARGAKQRHSVVDGTTGIENRGASNKSSPCSPCRILDAETETNPIDRSIAQLLLHSPSGGGIKMSNHSYI